MYILSPGILIFYPTVKGTAVCNQASVLQSLPWWRNSEMGSESRDLRVRYGRSSEPIFERALAWRHSLLHSHALSSRFSDVSRLRNAIPTKPKSRFQSSKPLIISEEGAYTILSYCGPGVLSRTWYIQYILVYMPCAFLLRARHQLRFG